jgi:hypothetical protein
MKDADGDAVEFRHDRNPRAPLVSTELSMGLLHLY